jgi:hypothetical protein
MKPLPHTATRHTASSAPSACTYGLFSGSQEAFVLILSIRNLSPVECVVKLNRTHQFRARCYSRTPSAGSMKVYSRNFPAN